MLKILVVLGIAVAVAEVQRCEKPSFTDTKIRALNYIIIDYDFDDSKRENGSDAKPFTGCITPTDQFKDAVQIFVNNQQVKVLHEGAVQDLPLLNLLNLEENGIEDIEARAFQKLPKMYSITLAKNRLQVIPEGVFNNMEVKSVYLNDNRISSIAPGAFDNMPNLSIIKLDHNNLQQWNSKWFTNSPKLFFLSVTSNQISELPDRAFINYNNQQQSSIGGIFLSNNKIQGIDHTAFAGLKELNILDLEYNNIINIDADVFPNLTNVNTLLLKGNKISCLSEQFLSGLPSTEVINLAENPLECTCLSEMQTWGMNHHVDIKTINSTIECMQ